VIKSALSIQLIQDVLKSLPDVDGWLIYNYRKSNPFAYEILGIATNEHITRRFFYWIPKQGEPVKIVHAIEPHIVKRLPGKELIYASWQELESLMTTILKDKKKVAMEYSPMNYIPTLSRIDAGTNEWLASFGISIISSWPILEQWLSRWTKEQRALHLEAAGMLDKVFVSSYQMIKDALTNEIPITELQVQAHILQFLHSNNFITSHAPICAVNDNAAKPHYTPSTEVNRPIKKGDLVLLDIWCKKNIPEAPFADFTQVALASNKQNQKMAKIYSIVLESQKAAIAFIKDRLAVKKDILGFEVDDVVREHISSYSLAQYFTHRTGHNIHTVVHGHATHLDNFETHDTRKLMPRTCFSIEPGIYLPEEYGIRLECNAYITNDLQLEITGNVEETLPLLFRT